jgi:hypothetical protein
MNRIQKLRRSAMSIAVDAHPTLFKLRRSGMFIRQFMESLVSLRACTVTINRRVLLPLLRWQDQLGRRREPGRGARLSVAAPRLIERFEPLCACGGP